MSLVMRLSGFFSLAIAMMVLSASMQSLYPAEAIRSSQLNSFMKQPCKPPKVLIDRFSFRRASNFTNADECISGKIGGGICDPSLVHVAITLDVEYLRGSLAAVHSILQHSEMVRSLISTSVRQALEQPLNYARNYLAELLEPCVKRVIYLDSDLIVVDDVAKLWRTDLAGRTIGAPEYCHANFSKYFTANFWNSDKFSKTFLGRKPCYFNTGVMVIDLVKWRRFEYTKDIEKWMEIQRRERIYELGSLPPFLLIFAGNLASIEHRWNQHGLGGDNVKGSCRDLHSGPVSLLHWSGSGKPWLRLDSKKACPLDSIWAPYDLYQHTQ